MKSIKANWQSALAGVCLLAGVTGVAAAEVVSTNAPFSHLTKLRQREIELSAQFNLLKDWAAQHALRAEQAEKDKQREKATWEQDLAAELRAKVDAVARELATVSSQRLALEKTRRGAETAGAGEAADQDEAAFFSRLDTLLWQVDQEMNLTAELVKGFSAELQTNNAPEDVLRISFQVQENNNLMRYLEREKSNLELLKLQYLALRRRPAK